MAEEENNLIIISDDDSSERDTHATMTNHSIQVHPEAACKAQVVTVFPDICPEYLDGLAQKYGNDSSTLIASILDEVDKGTAIPTRQRSMLKRKRDEREDEELGVEKLAKTYSDASRHAELRNIAYVKQAYVQAYPVRYHNSCLLLWRRLTNPSQFPAANAGISSGARQKHWKSAEDQPELSVSSLS
jgi:hypothetical protein